MQGLANVSRQGIQTGRQSVTDRTRVVGGGWVGGVICEGWDNTEKQTISGKVAFHGN